MFLNRKAYYFLIGLFCFTSSIVSGQDQKLADSLLTIYQEGKLEGLEKLELLRNLSFNEIHNLDASIRYAEELITLAEQEGNYLYLHRGYIQKGNSHRLAGDLNAALAAFFKSADASVKANYFEGEGNTYTAIADTYSEIGNSENSEIYYDKAIVILRKTNDSIPLATTLLNAGDEYFNSKKYELALRNYEESGLIFENANYKIGKAYNLGNVGMVYAEQGKDSLATAHMNDAITILEKLEDYSAISEYLTYMSDIYMKQKNSTTALAYAQRSFDLALKHGLKKQISESSLTLSELHERYKNIPTSFNYYKSHIAYRDSVTNLEGIAKMADLRTDYEVSQKQVEVDLLNEQKRKQLIILGFTSLLLLILFWFYRTISKERKKSEKLLLNILPKEVAEELKNTGKATSKKYDNVSILFTDFIGFTQLVASIPATKLIEELNHIFGRFDDIMEEFQVEKIETIGDAYMAACGLPEENVNHAQRCVQAAQKMVSFLNERNSTNDIQWNMRVGIHSGPVVAGVVGKKKFAYDLFGDSVNTAARMESNGEPEKINISQATYELLKDEPSLIFQSRGQILAKGKGQMKMYFVEAKLK